MLKRKLMVPAERLYPPDEWRIIERRFSERYFARAETVLSLSNGYLGIRGTFEEGRPAVSPGTFVNGFHEVWSIVHAEDAYGLARTGQTMLKVPDATIIRLYVDDEPLFLPTARLRHYERVLDMRSGTLTRNLMWSTGGGKRVLVRSSRLVSLEHRHTAAFAYEVVVLDHAAPVVISSEVVNRQDADDATPAPTDDPRRPTRLAGRVLNPEVVLTDGDRLLLGYRTTSSRMSLGVAVEHVIECEAQHQTSASINGDRGAVVLEVEAEPDVPIRLVKFVAYQTSRSAPPAELVDRCSRSVRRVARGGLPALLAAQRANLERFWDRTDVRVDPGGEITRMQQAIRWNLFQVAQATWRAEGSGVAAKGLTGQAYEGHYFWDTEVYLVPLLAFTYPRIARNLLRFRHALLPAARKRARDLGHRGAMFPWRTINGEEASAYYQAGTAQYHLNADIAHAIRQYVNVRGDLDFLVEVGAEMLVETARLWADLGFYARDGEFHIHGVTGPDEYTTVVNDNTYTNLMARENLAYAAGTVRRLALERPDAHAALVADLELTEDELEGWERAAASMHVPYDPESGIHPQDASFLDREVWNLEATPADRFPLLLHFHPLEIYRHQVIKQADIVLAMFLLGAEFDADQKLANYDYYDRLTSGDSSLSASVQSIMASEVGREDDALEYFRFAVLMDLADVAGNASDGVHIASAAGVWHALVFGFGGVRERDGELLITPRLPRLWRSLEFPLRFRDHQLRVCLTHEAERYVLETDDPLDVAIRGERRRLIPGTPLTLTPAASR